MAGAVLWQPQKQIYITSVKTSSLLQSVWMENHYFIPCQSDLQTKCINSFSNFPVGSGRQ